jgi:hypothetical protein
MTVRSAHGVDSASALTTRLPVPGPTRPWGATASRSSARTIESRRRRGANDACLVRLSASTALDVSTCVRCGTWWLRDSAVPTLRTRDQ